MLIRKGGVFKDIPERRVSEYARFGYVKVDSEPEPAKEEPKEPDKEPDSYVCPVCGKEYKTERGLSKHMETHKDGEDNA